MAMRAAHDPSHEEKKPASKEENVELCKLYKENLNVWMGNTPRREDKSLEELTKELADLTSQLRPPTKASDNTAIQEITKLIAYKHAEKIIDDFAALKAENPDANIDIYMLKRHEVSTNAHKWFGFKKDTGLSAVDAVFKKAQTENDLLVSQMIHSATVEALKESGLVDHVTLSISPIRRAWQTAVRAVFRHDIPDQTEVNSDYAETKHGFAARNFARSSAVRSKKEGLLPAMKELGGFSARFNDNAFVDVESDPKSQDARVKKANETFFERPVRTKETSFNVLVAHGGVIGDMMDKLRKDDKVPNSIPPGKVKMDYGDFKIVCIARDKQGKVLAASGGGTYSRFGITRCALMSAKEFKKKSHRLPDLKKSKEICNLLDKYHHALKPQKKSPIYIRKPRSRENPEAILDSMEKKLQELQNQLTEFDGMVHCIESWEKERKNVWLAYHTADYITDNMDRLKTLQEHLQRKEGNTSAEIDLLRYMLKLKSEYPNSFDYFTTETIKTDLTNYLKSYESLANDLQKQIAFERARHSSAASVSEKTKSKELTGDPSSPGTHQLRPR